MVGGGDQERRAEPGEALGHALAGAGGGGQYLHRLERPPGGQLGQGLDQVRPFDGDGDARDLGRFDQGGQHPGQHGNARHRQDRLVADSGGLGHGVVSPGPRARQHKGGDGHQPIFRS
jgi:hypothetical protein